MQWLCFCTLNNQQFFPFIKIINQRYYCDHTMRALYVPTSMWKKYPLMWYKVKCFSFFFCIFFVILRLSQRQHRFKPAVNVYGAWPYKECTTHCFEYQCGYILLSCPYQISQKDVLYEQVFWNNLLIFVHMISRRF